ncbi:hypothetical protein CC86DRAFT_456838 [Ophiobolus disseminans]|uniref:Mid2 domain-containing protein n=1 Tax=Ophiobolus disseminans TaxID=1469910 RepID=A0A6A6ZX02_9PLEO|nr:hypothetical protein CC86DRAFT_456838 [Ophiobolus disseminans]
MLEIAFVFALCSLFSTYAHPLDNGKAETSSTFAQLQTLLVNGTTSNPNATPTAIPNPSNLPGAPTSGGFPTEHTIGTAVGGAIGGLFIVLLLVFWILKRKKNAKRKSLNVLATESKPIAGSAEKIDRPASPTANVGLKNRASVRTGG